MIHSSMKFLAGAALAIGLGACQGGTVSQGTASTSVQGAAAGGASAGAAANLQRCAQPYGTLAMDDGRSYGWYGEFTRATGVTNLEPLLRLAVQQSNCFVITSIGNTRLDSRMSQITQQQRNSGEFRAGSNQQAGQRVAADYFMEPAIIISEDPTGQLAAGIGGLFGSVGAAVGAGLQSKVSVVTLSLFDIRSQVQISASEGSATASNFGAAVGALGGGAGGALGGYSRTPEGKATVAAFTDAYNKMVIALKNYRAQTVAGGLGTGGTLTVN